MPGYNTYRKDRDSENTGGGVIIYAKNNIKCNELYINTTNIEAVAIQLDNGQVLVAAYQTPQDLLLEQDLDTLFNLSTSVLIIGDFNSKHPDWNCHQPNTNGNWLRRYLDNRAYVLLPSDTHTRYSDTNCMPSTIDFVLIKNTVCTILETIHELDSDHVPIILEINAKHLFHKNKNYCDIIF